MPTRTITMDGATWEVFPSGRAPSARRTNITENSS